MERDTLFPADYSESRQRFLGMAEWLGAEVQSYPVETDDGVVLSTDTACLGSRDAPKLVVLASGTHGVEGYAGAACQHAFMQTYAGRRAACLENGVAFLLVHAVNPWGFHHDRRVTREGIDLNRNFVDFSRPPLPASAYAAYHDLLVSNYRPLPAGLWNKLTLLGIALDPERVKAARAAITGGQYERADGLFFGGAGAARSRLAWEQIIEANAGGRDLSVLLDIHTGLGQRGTCALLSTRPAADPGYQRMSGWFEEPLQSMPGGDAVSAAIEGSLTGSFDRFDPGKSHALGLEFGTLSPLAVLEALRADQWASNHAATLSGDVRARIRNKMRNAFAPADPRWQRQVVAHFTRVMDQLLTALARRAAASGLPCDSR